MREIAVTISNANKFITPLETIDAIASAGFKNVFIEWYNKDWEISQEEQLNYIRSKGLNIIFAHLGYQKINDLWLDNEIGKGHVERFKNDIRICKLNGIDLVVMHLTSKDVAPKYNEIGLNRLKEIVDYASDLGVKVAFENTKVKGYQEYVVQNIDEAGICFDSGHYHAHFNDELDFSLFNNKVFAVHLHDNHGSEDEHLIPFDGTLDWEYIIKELKDNHYDGPITMELVYRNDYLKMSQRESPNIRRVAIRYKNDPQSYYKEFILVITGRDAHNNRFCTQDSWAY